MTSQELILINSDKVRRDSSLMAFYIETFIASFGYKPTCTGCSFSSDWTKLVRFINTGEKSLNLHQQKLKEMNTFKLKKTTNTIYAYKLDGKVHRRYDNRFDEAFAIAFLTNGTDAEIEERKKMFAILPDEFKPKDKKGKIEIDYLEINTIEVVNQAETAEIEIVQEINDLGLEKTIENVSQTITKQKRKSKNKK